MIKWKFEFKERFKKFYEYWRVCYFGWYPNYYPPFKLIKTVRRDLTKNLYPLNDTSNTYCILINTCLCVCVCVGGKMKRLWEVGNCRSSVTKETEGFVRLFF